ncbi:Z1 domain-containing protein [Streptomyces sp. NBC_00847]|uniref:Z1 domain-containing protein n=1 Tax=Streptomyces sp. NBC_00847 TaxID=2975850 RepID=UPI002251A850|nr:Z1 domain-containing protein [Streptomyces sp. NBC_00847]MCX4882470.1 Z1 domain-containing protein [Streptomyces sp. NBC_00847]
MQEFEDQYEAFKRLIKTHTPEQALATIKLFGMSDELAKRIAERHQRETIAIREKREPGSVVRNNRETWYLGPQEGDRCWPALRNLLARQRWKDDSLGDLDSASTKVVSMLDHPLESSFSTRGLVVGYVQSGKTSNFTALIAKAADAGYKFFIVLAGIHNGLRLQTQMRLERQLVEPVIDQWHPLTGRLGDFEPPAGNPAAFFGDRSQQHVLCVIKKNVPRLRKLKAWLEKAPDYLSNCPTLIIDDEADQASVASRSTNPLIREIIDLFPRGGYVGYTATPFANLLIDPAAKNLYPEDFVVNLPKPKGHFGTEVLFGREALDGEDPQDVPDGYDMIRTVPEEEVPLVRPARDEIEDFVPEISGALRTAVLYFWLVTAARRVRGTGVPHSTMLIHTSVSTQVHESFEWPLERFRTDTAANLEAADKESLDELRQLWETELARVPGNEPDFGEIPVPFDALLPRLASVVDDCRIVLDNSKSVKRLDYETGPVVAIAVGGNTLSRGLTLEGLAVSYFVRNASTYDSLLQMGRWFGFRDGYADLPRIWMTDAMRDWFRHIATVESEMRRDVDVYMIEDKTPTTFAVRMRTHPSLRITAAGKMRDAVKASAAYGGQRVQTRYFRTQDAEWLKTNRRAAHDLVDRSLRLAGARHEDRGPQGRHVLRGVPYDIVLDFLDEYRFHDKSLECDAGLLRSYVERRVRSGGGGALKRWNVAIIGNPLGGDPDKRYEFAPGIAVDRVIRAKLGESGSDAADIKTLMSRRDAGVDLDLSALTEINEAALKNARREQAPDTALLTLYPIDAHSPSPTNRESRAPLDAVDHVIGVGLVFPMPRGEDSEVEYYSADLSRVQDDEEEDLSLLFEEDDS